MDPLLIFDLGNVITRVDFGRFAERITRGTPRTPEEAFQTFSTGPDKAALDRGQRSPWHFAGLIRAWLGTNAPGEREILAAWADIFDLIDGAEAGLARCRQEHEVWLLSDTDPTHFAHCLNTFSPVRRFERYLLSYDRGHLKRDPGAFDDLAVLVRDGRRLVFVDDLPINIRAATDAGLEAILFEGWDHLEGDLRSRGILR